jgi:CTP synthase (UTP-ammonia lyase)
MVRTAKVGIIGDYNPELRFHIATVEALKHAAKALSVAVDVQWLPTESLAERSARKTLEQFDALWCSPGSPYRSMDGALEGIRFARERGRPFFGTWGGFQHALVEYARNVLGIRDAEHEESAPGASTLFISKLACSLVGKTQKIEIAPDSLASQAYGGKEVLEQFFCNYGLNPAFRAEIDQGDLVVSGVDSEGEVRIVEIPAHPFYLATLFLPQVASKPDSPHPLIAAYLQAAVAVKAGKTTWPERSPKPKPGFERNKKRRSGPGDRTGRPARIFHEDRQKERIRGW